MVGNKYFSFKYMSIFKVNVRNLNIRISNYSESVLMEVWFILLHKSSNYEFLCMCMYTQ